MSDSLESPVCVRVKAEPLWDLSASCEPETAGPIERVVKIERDSEGDKSSWGLFNHKVKEELQNVQNGHADHDMERSGSEESNEALWGLSNDKVKEELNAHGGLIDHDIKAKSCESEEGDKPDLWSLYNDHKVKEELVLGPEEFHRPKVTLLCRAGGLSNQTCLVRLEQMQVDMERHTCSIGRNTYKFRHCFLSYEECTEESSTSNKLDAREYGVSTAPLSLCASQQLALEFSVRLERLREPPRASEPCPVTAHREPSSVEDLPGKTQHISDTDHPGTKSSRKKRIHQKTLAVKPYMCAHCSYASNYQGRLEKHEKTHRREKQYKCTYCSYIASQKADLRSHVTIHTVTYTYECAHCTYTTNYKSNFKKHEMIHGDKSYKCACCSYSSNYERCLKRHQMVHSSIYRHIIKKG